MKRQAEPTDTPWARMREAQALTSLKSPSTAMAVITDAGDEKDIHPKKKEPAGARLALAARAIAYGEKIEYSGPVYENIKIEDGKAVLSFTHVRGGLEAKDGKLIGLTVVGAERNFLYARPVV